MRTLFCILSVGCFMLGVVGCGKSPDVQAPTRMAIGAKTPVELIGNLQKAMADGNRDAYLVCFDIEDKQRDRLGTHFEMFQAMRGFDDKLREVFGDQGVEQLSSGDGVRIASENLFARFIETPANDFEIAQEADKTTCRPPFGGVLTMAKVGDVWKLDSPYLPLPIREEEPSEPTSRSFRFDVKLEPTPEMLNDLAAIYRDMTAKVGRPGMTLEKLQEMMSQRIMENAQKQMQLMLEQNPELMRQMQEHMPPPEE